MFSAIDKLIELVDDYTDPLTVRDIHKADFATEFANFLIANSVTVLPCNIGDRVWAIRCFKGVKHPQDGIVSEMFFTKDMKLHIIVKYVARGEWGKSVFPTREAAEEYMRKEKEHGK